VNRPAEPVNDDRLQKRATSAIVEKGQYALAIIVVAAMLIVAGFPAFVIFFFGIFAYFLWKIFTSGSRSETRDIFEFYLAANEILRDDDRRWYGFEVRDCIVRGLYILQSMSHAPPLVYFTLGALQHKIGEYKEAVANLSIALDGDRADELAFVNPSSELRNYVKVLRKIEREPAEAPMTSAAIRSLERARRLRGKSILEDSRRKAAEAAEPVLLAESTEEKVVHASFASSVEKDETAGLDHESDQRTSPVRSMLRQGRRERTSGEKFKNRKPISEVLHDIYDEGTH
jgi:hypothetical protein